MSPPDAERVSCRVGIHLVAFLGLQVARSKERGAQPGRLLVRSNRVRDVQVQVDLLRTAVWPARSYVIRRQLHADAPLTGRVEHTMKGRVVIDDAAPEQARPEGALPSDLSRIENNHLANGVHATEPNSTPNGLPTHSASRIAMDIAATSRFDLPSIAEGSSRLDGAAW